MAKSLVDFKGRVRPEPDWVVPGLLKRGNTLFIIGPPKKACKSWLMLDMAWDLSEGHPVWGIKTPDSVKPDGEKVEGRYLFQPSRAMRTVYLAQEDTEDDVHDRVMAHFSSGRAENDRLWVIPKDLKITLDSEAGKRKLEQELDGVAEQAGKIDLVMFDPFRRMHHGDENDSMVIAKIWSVLDNMHKRYGCSTMISHHTIKPPADKSMYDPTDPFVARGSGDIYGGGDAFITVVPKKLTNEPPSRKVAIHFESKRGRPLPPAMLKVHFGTGAVEYLGQAWERQQNEEDSETHI
jgi:hypothetical protein